MIKPRTLARRLALQYCFVCDINENWSADGWENFLEDSLDESDEGLTARVAPFAKELVDAVLSQREMLDGRITRYLHNWDINRLAAVERNVLRLAAAELVAGALDRSIIISEAIGLAKNFGGKDSGKFVNGVLDALADS